LRTDHTSNTNRAKKGDCGNRFKRGFFFVFGTLFLAFGGVGVFVPVLPTTPFLLISAACYYKSSERMHRWMLNNRWFGHYLKNYAEGKGLSLKAKLFTISLLWLLMIYSIFFVVSNLVVQLILLSIAIGVTAHLVRLPTLTEK
jgi:uncharacterized membrane protein YbaN (DUF454 family)